MKISKKTIKEKLGKIPRFLAEKAFFTFLVLFIMALIISALIIYKYIIIVQKISPEITEKQLQFRERDYQEILNAWQERDEKFKEADLKQYLDPFSLGAAPQGLTR